MFDHMCPLLFYYEYYLYRLDVIFFLVFPNIEKLLTWSLVENLGHTNWNILIKTDIKGH